MKPRKQNLTETAGAWTENQTPDFPITEQEYG
jgi:hypothetical protein